MRLSIEKINHTPGLQSAKNYSYAVTVYKKMNAFERLLPDLLMKPFSADV
jgi:hypothetical protein